MFTPLLSHAIDGSGPLLTAADLRNPIEGDFHIAAEIDMIEPVLFRIAEEFDAYGKSGSRAWDLTMDARNLPAWLLEMVEHHADYAAADLEPAQGDGDGGGHDHDAHGEETMVDVAWDTEEEPYCASSATSACL